MLIYSNKDNLEKILKDNNKVVINFYTDWCPPCQYLKPIFEKSDESNKDVAHVLVDVDAYPKLSTEWGVSRIPTLVTLKDSEEKERISGVIREEDLSKKIEKL